MATVSEISTRVRTITLWHLLPIIGARTPGYGNQKEVAP